MIFWTDSRCAIVPPGGRWGPGCVDRLPLRVGTSRKEVDNVDVDPNSGVVPPQPAPRQTSCDKNVKVSTAKPSEDRLANDDKNRTPVDVAVGVGPPHLGSRAQLTPSLLSAENVTHKAQASKKRHLRAMATCRSAIKPLCQEHGACVPCAHSEALGKSSAHPSIPLATGCSNLIRGPVCEAFSAIVVATRSK